MWKWDRFLVDRMIVKKIGKVMVRLRLTKPALELWFCLKFWWVNFTIASLSTKSDKPSSQFSYIILKLQNLMALANSQSEENIGWLQRFVLFVVILAKDRLTYDWLGYRPYVWARNGNSCWGQIQGYCGRRWPRWQGIRCIV